MEPPTIREIRITAQLQVLQQFVISLVQRCPELWQTFEKSHNLDPELSTLGAQSLLGQPEISDMLTTELQEAWRQLITQVRMREG